DGTAALPRGSAALGRGALIELRFSAHLEPIFGQEELQGEGAARQGLAVPAMAGIDVRQLVHGRAIADAAAATASFGGLGHGVLPFAFDASTQAVCGLKFAIARARSRVTPKIERFSGGFQLVLESAGALG